MYSVMCPTIQVCPALLDGFGRLAECAAKSYGNGKKIAYRNKAGDFRTEADFSTVISDMACTEPGVQAALGLLAQHGCPQDGAKTAVLLLHGLLREAHARGIRENELCAAIGPVTSYMKEYLARVDKETGKGLPGGGLYFINLARPLDDFANRNPAYAAAARLMISALADPLKALAGNAKLDPCEVYERVKALAPNQFFSLNHFGLERSIDRETAHVDVVEIGLDLTDGRIKNLLDADILVPLETACAVLDCVAEMTMEICKIADVLL